MPTPDSLLKRLDWEIQEHCNLSDCHRSAIEVHDPVRATIVGLLCGGSPSAIGRLVISVVVYALNRVFAAWGLTHISDKALKAPPLFAYRNPAPAVPRKTLVGWIGTPTTHLAPNGIDARFTHAVGFENGAQLRPVSLCERPKFPARARGGAFSPIPLLFQGFRKILRVLAPATSDVPGNEQPFPVELRIST